MAIAIIVGRETNPKKQDTWFENGWKDALLALDPSLDIRIWPEVGDFKEIDAAFVWCHPYGLLNEFPNLKLIASLAAGVDHIFADKHLPKQVPIVRVMDPYMANDITQYVLACVLQHVKRMEAWDSYQKEKRWMKRPPFNFAEKTIGIMGLGFLGEKSARALLHIGLKVIGWRNSAKELDGIKTFFGKAQLKDFLAQSEILICMLPLTSETLNILNKETFSLLPKGSFLINLGRGEELVEEDLLQALDSGQLSGAFLDVFRQEPLPPEHPFWIHPKIHVTPHIASVTNAATAAPQVLDNYHRMMTGKPLMNKVDTEKGY